MKTWTLVRPDFVVRSWNLTTESAPMAPDAPAADAALEVFIGRQPVFNARLDVVAYELLFRDGRENRAAFSDGEHATARVFTNTFMEIGFDLVTAKKPALVNVTRDFIVGEYARLFPEGRVLLEVLEHVAVDELVLERLKALKNDGYKIVLDDFVLTDSTAPLLDLADIVKLDVLGLSTEEVARQVDSMRVREMQFLAEKIETHEMFEFCKREGFSLFQGYFLSKPQIIEGRRPPADRFSLIRLLAVVNDPRAELDQLETVVSSDAALSLRLMRYINSAFFATSTKVSSIRHALVYMGLRMVRAWVNLVILSGVSDKPGELVVQGMLRAKMCERLAAAAGRTDVDASFTVGLFSIIDALMDRPLSELLEELPLTDEIKSALLEHQGPLGEILELVLSYEKADWEHMRVLGLDAKSIQGAYFDSLKWVELVKNGLA